MFLLSNSRTDLESVVAWGDFPAAAVNNIFPPDACWGLRRGRAHVVEDVSIGPNCPHLLHTVPAPYVCLPLMAKGDILGLLHLKNLVPGNNSEITALRQMAVTLSEYVSSPSPMSNSAKAFPGSRFRTSKAASTTGGSWKNPCDREIMRAARKKTTIGIIMGDIDHFKKFNDDYGHAAGDKIITHIGKIINDRFRGSDVACRYGGEEFLIILPETSRQDTFKRAEVLREEIKKMDGVFPGQVAGTITMSLGVAAYPENGLRMEDLLRAADTALYKAKQERPRPRHFRLTASGGKTSDFCAGFELESLLRGLKGRSNLREEGQMPTSPLE